MQYIDFKEFDSESYLKEYDLQGYGTVIKDISYGKKSENQKIDLYLPIVSNKPIPVIVYVHGGGLMKGDKTRHLKTMLQGLAFGYAIAAVNYRLLDECVYPEMLYDVTTAIRFIKSISKQYQLNPDKLIVWGETHGAYLACQVGINGGKNKIDDMSAGYTEYDSKVAGVIDYWAFTSFEDMYNFELISNKGNKDVEYLEEKIFNAKGEALLKTLQNSHKPLEDITKDVSPFYILHGEYDDEIPLIFSKAYYVALKNIGADVEFEFAQNCKHSLINFTNAQQIEGTYDFIHRIFK